MVGLTAVLSIPLGVAAAIHLEEFANRDRWYNRFIELNVQNLAAVPAIIYGMLALGVLALAGFQSKNIVLGGAVALALLILPVIIIATRESLRAVPEEIRDGSLALGATQWQTTCGRRCPRRCRASRRGRSWRCPEPSVRPHRCSCSAALTYVAFDPNGILSGFTTMPIQIFNWTSHAGGVPDSRPAASILLLAMLLAMNALAIYIRNKYQRRW